MGGCIIGFHPHCKGHLPNPGWWQLLYLQRAAPHKHSFQSNRLLKLLQ